MLFIGISYLKVNEEKIFTYYQPIVSNNSTKTKHYEVLCRLMDNNKLVDAKKVHAQC